MTRRARSWPLALLAGLLTVYLLAPIVVLLVHLPAGHRGPAAPGLASALGISLLTATISTAIIALFGIPLGWMLANGRGRLRAAIGVIVQLPLALPPLMSGILLVQVVGPYTLLGRLFGGHLTDTTAAIVIAQTFVASPFLIIAARSAFATIDPALLEVAATLGHGNQWRFWRVSLPLAAPGIRAGLLLAWLRAFGEFGATVILAYHPYSLPVFTFVQFGSTGLPSALAPTAAALGAAAVVLTLMHLGPERWAWRRLTARAVGRPAPTPHGRAGDGRGWRPGRPSTGSGAPATEPEPLAFELRAHLGSFSLELVHRGRTPHLAILGPSGAGKTLALRCLAGLLGPEAGELRLGSRELGSLAAEQRRVGWVPQDAALFPHLTVWRQTVFGVGADPLLAAEWLARLGLEDLHDRLPAQLSGGQRQRVALVRALACRPRLLLLDEPFSSLDAPVRDELRRDLRRFQRELPLTTVIVTHDPQEAALLAEEVIVLADGAMLQSGARAEVFGRPASPQVARLLSIDNLHGGEVVRPGWIASNGTELEIADRRLEAGTRVAWCLRSAHVELHEARGCVAGSHRAVALDIVDLGAWREVSMRLDGGLELSAMTADGSWLARGSECRVSLPPQRLTVWPQPQ